MKIHHKPGVYKDPERRGEHFSSPALHEKLMHESSVRSVLGIKKTRKRKEGRSQKHRSQGKPPQQIFHLSLAPHPINNFFFCSFFHTMISSSPEGHSGGTSSLRVSWAGGLCVVDPSPSFSGSAALGTEVSSPFLWSSSSSLLGPSHA